MGMSIEFIGKGKRGTLTIPDDNLIRAVFDKIECLAPFEDGSYVLRVDELNLSAMYLYYDKLKADYHENARLLAYDLFECFKTALKKADIKTLFYSVN